MTEFPIPNRNYIALIKNELAGFCCFNSTALGYIGPIGVVERYRLQGIGGRLLNATCYEMKTAGYGYAVVGWVEHVTIQFYQRVTGAVVIPDSEPGLYRDMIEQTG
jgi:GNAT superfamily N-acetyltransferase